MRKISKITRRNYVAIELQFEEGLWYFTLDNVRLCSDEGQLIADTSEILMQHIADEWEEQSDEINVANMPLTRLLVSLLDLSDLQLQHMRNSIMEYVGNEMLAMRDEANENIYSPILQQVKEFLQVEYSIHTQLIPPPQPKILLEKLEAWLENQPPKTLLTHYVLTQTLGSFALSVAAIHLQLEPTIIMQAAWLEHDLQMQKWGEEASLLAKRNNDAKQLLACRKFMQ